MQTCDGDELNLHLSQAIGGRVECMTSSNTRYHMVSAQHNGPVMGCVQNTLVLNYMITETFLTPELVRSEDAPLEPNYTFPNSTKKGWITMIRLTDFMDAIVKADISMERFEDLKVRARIYYPDYVTEDADGHLRFTDLIPGKIVASAPFPAKMCWSRKTETNLMLETVEIERGIVKPDSGPICKKCIGPGSGSAVHTLWKMSPYTSVRVVSEFQAITAVLIKRLGFSMGFSACLPIDRTPMSKAIEEAMIRCELINQSNKDATEKENEINGELNRVMDHAPKLAREGMNFGDRSPIVIMKKSGAKGVDANNGAIAGCVGQQNIDGKRAPMILTNGTRTLSHFKSGDNSPGARGFVSHSYLEGLTPQEAWFHAAGGRRGIIDTGMKTADSGYISKKIGRKMEDLHVYYDMSIRGANDEVVEFAYGGDGFNAKEVIYTKGLSFPFFANMVVLAQEYNAEMENAGEVPDGEAPRSLTEEEAELLCSFIQAGAPGIQTPVIQRITFNVHIALRVALDEVKIYEAKIPEYCRRLKDEFEWSKATNGYAAGLVAANCIGEPTTQMVLNTFHHSGSSAKDVTLGLPRLKELFDASKKPSRPTCTIFVESEAVKENSAAFKKLQDTIKKNDDAIKEVEKELKRGAVTKRKGKGKKGKENGGADVEALKTENDALADESKKLEAEGLKLISKFAAPIANLNVGYFLKSHELRYLCVEGEVPEASPIGLLTYEEYEPKWWTTLSEQINKPPPFQPQSWVIILQLDIDKLYRHSTSTDHIAIRIEEEALSNKGYTLACVASPDNIGQIEVYINFADITPYVQAKFELPTGTETRSLITTQNTEYFTAREVAMAIIKNTQVQGITGIRKTRVRQNLVTGEWVVDTQGSNFLSVLNTPGVDATRTMSDNMWEVYNVLGIEAARKFLVKEATAVLSFDGTYINPRHVRLLISSMCYSGIITGANRDGISRKAGPVAKGMFEKPVDNFAEASIFGEKDNLKGVAASVMFGTLANLGTGSVKIRDLEKMPATKKHVCTTRKPVAVPVKSVKPVATKSGKKK